MFRLKLKLKIQVKIVRKISQPFCIEKIIEKKYEKNTMQKLYNLFLFRLYKLIEAWRLKFHFQLNKQNLQQHLFDI